MKTFTIPVILWLCAFVGLLLTLLANGALETIGLGLLTTPILLVARYAFTTAKT